MLFFVELYIESPNIYKSSALFFILSLLTVNNISVGLQSELLVYIYARYTKIYTCCDGGTFSCWRKFW